MSRFTGELGHTVVRELRFVLVALQLKRRADRMKTGDAPRGFSTRRSTAHILFPLFFLTGCLAAFGAEPKLNEATLEWKGKVLRPRQIVQPAQPEYRVGSNLLTLSNGIVRALEPETRR